MSTCLLSSRFFQVSICSSLFLFIEVFLLLLYVWYNRSANGAAEDAHEEEEEEEEELSTRVVIAPESEIYREKELAKIHHKGETKRRENAGRDRRRQK